MKLTLSHGKRDVVNLDVTLSKKDHLALSVQFWHKHPDKPAATPTEQGPALRASGHLASSERRGWTSSPDTVVFGFGRN